MENPPPTQPRFTSLRFKPSYMPQSLTWGINAGLLYRAVAWVTINHGELAELKYY